jgi:hypothetical protein
MNDNKDYGERGAILDVPYDEKDEAKKLGARWDPDLKKWFVPRGVSTSPFQRWMAKLEPQPASR